MGTGDFGDGSLGCGDFGDWEFGDGSLGCEFGDASLGWITWIEVFVRDGSFAGKGTRLGAVLLLVRGAVLLNGTLSKRLMRDGDALHS